ncbi:MAG: hypothetical protein J5I98_33135 [Phaeodactylibacter sp.]|nr:hypothetical protein [Phaeodactylibacter sp.]
MYRTVLTPVIFLLLPLLAGGHDFIREAEKLKGLPTEQFLDRYPFREYIEVCDYDNIRDLEFQKNYLDRMGLDGRAFIYRLYEQYVAHAEMDFGNVECMKKLLYAGELMSRSKLYLHPDSALVYSAAGDLVLSAIADSLETLLEKGRLDKRDFGVQYIIRRLDENQYGVDVPLPNWEKLLMHARNGNFGYIWRKATGTYIREFCLFLAVAIPGFCLFLWLAIRFARKHKHRKVRMSAKKKDIAALFLLSCSLFSWTIPAGGPANSISEHYCNSALSGQVKTYELRERAAGSANSSLYGHSVWMDLSLDNIKAAYLPGQSHFTRVYERFSSWKAGKDILLSSSGAYAVQGYKDPLGFTMDEGAAVNNHWKEDMDALVVLDGHRLEVYNKEQRFVADSGQRFNLADGMDRAAFANWGENNGLTIFQTHLLAYDGQLTITEEGRNKVAKRKFLALASVSGKEYAVLVYAKGNYLYDAARDVFSLLKARPGCQVRAMVNLDTGVQDVLELHPALQACNGNAIKGFVASRYAMNLLAFYTH